MTQPESYTTIGKFIEKQLVIYETALITLLEERLQLQDLSAEGFVNQVREYYNELNKDMAQNIHTALLQPFPMPQIDD